jgi:outer membrane murein-binding lipoprotein Lpp
MSMTRFAFWILLAPSVLLAGCVAPKPAPDQLAQVLARTSALEQQVRALEKANAELRTEVRALQETNSKWPVPPGGYWLPGQVPHGFFDPGQVPRAQRPPPQTPPPNPPKGEPPLTPLETK